MPQPASSLQQRLTFRARVELRRGLACPRDTPENVRSTHKHQ
ncbi:Uncharacterized protein ToN1_26440 [Aromatoleum petrolei]|nr:Uncharacterized protein ToN1_26440 [Aromatoleum petrolei]